MSLLIISRRFSKEPFKIFNPSHPDPGRRENVPFCDNIGRCLYSLDDKTYYSTLFYHKRVIVQDFFTKFGQASKMHWRPRRAFSLNYNVNKILGKNTLICWLQHTFWRSRIELICRLNLKSPFTKNIVNFQEIKPATQQRLIATTFVNFLVDGVFSTDLGVTSRFHF